MTPEQKTRLDAKVAQWNAEGIAKPGPKVRTYRVNPDGSIGVLDVLWEEVEGNV
ncbi:hypothetical protein D3C71_2148500 [compost metagenome]